MPTRSIQTRWTASAMLEQQNHSPRLDDSARNQLLTYTSYISDVSQ